MAAAAGAGRAGQPHLPSCAFQTPAVRARPLAGVRGGLRRARTVAATLGLRGASRESSGERWVLQVSASAAAGDSGRIWWVAGASRPVWDPAGACLPAAGMGEPVRRVGTYREHLGARPVAHPDRVSAHWEAGNPRGARFTASRAGRRRKEGFVSFCPPRAGARSPGEGWPGCAARERERGMRVRRCRSSFAAKGGPGLSGSSPVHLAVARVPRTLPQRGAGHRPEAKAGLR